MKKLFILALAAVMMAGCNSKAPLGYRFVEIDSCEYIDGYNQLAHKGNCRFCAERRKAELRELLREIKEK
jgi:hypothetical protein